MTVLIIALLAGWGAGARADINVGVSADENGLREFHLAVGDFYGYPEREVVAVRERRIPDEELPVVLFLAREARVAPSVIIGLRLGGKSWMDITYYYGRGANIYYVETRTVSGPPYGKAIGYFKNKPKKQWKYIKLSDDDVVNLVNLKFISRRYKCSPDDVIRMRSEGRNFVDINRSAKDGKIHMKADNSSKDKDNSGHSKSSGGKSKGKSKRK